MTILVLMGGTSLVQEKVLSELMSAKPGRVENLRVVNEFIGINRRLKRYKALFDRKQLYDRLTVVVGVEATLEVEYLRELGATFCHVRGPLAPAFLSVPMLLSDIHVAPLKYKGFKSEMVLTPEEVISECFIRGRKIKACRK
jgi:hypothetical protein